MLLWWVFSFFFFSSRRRHTRFKCDWSSDVCSSDLGRRECLRWSNPPVQLDRVADATRVVRIHDAKLEVHHLGKFGELHCLGLRAPVDPLDHLERSGNHSTLEREPLFARRRAPSELSEIEVRFG